MRILTILALIVAATGFTARDAQAQGKYWPWCAYYDTWSYNCGFVTLQQCMATVSGAGGFCRLNPYPGPAADVRPAKRKRR